MALVMEAIWKMESGWMPIPEGRIALSKRPAIEDLVLRGDHRGDAGNLPAVDAFAKRLVDRDRGSRGGCTKQSLRLRSKENDTSELPTGKVTHDST